MSNQFYVDSSEANGTIFTNDQQSAVSVTFTASGTWNTGSRIDYGPEGKVGTRSKNAPYPNNTLYALLAVNSNNEVVGEGANISLTLEANENVRFVVNDTHYPNNRGQLTVDWQANAQQAQSDVRQIDGSDSISEYVKEHKAELEELRAAANVLNFEGKWVIIGDDCYPEKRVQYATSSVAKKVASPRIILYAAGDRDIRKAILLCRAFEMEISVRTGGHQYSGYSSTSPKNMQIDLSETYPEYNYDPVNNVLRCGVSQGLGDWARKNNEEGIYLPMGVCATVNLGGHVHTGGWGIVARSHGLLADHVLAFEIILANGCKKRIVKPEAGITNQQNDDLFYAVLGGGRGGDFGIVTHWEFRPIRDEEHPNSECYTYLWPWNRRRMRKVVDHMQDVAKKCADGTIPSDYEFMLNITGRGEMNFLSEPMKLELRKQEDIEIDENTKEMPPFIQMWMCFTNKEGEDDKFDDQWFKSFKEACGPLPPVRNLRPKMPVSKGLAEHFIMDQEREMEYPFVKRARPTMDIPDEFSQTYAERMEEIMGEDGTVNDQHLVSQMQIYAGGILAQNGESEITSYSWRDVVLGMSYDSFYSGGGLGSVPHQTAQEWQSENDEVFVDQEAFADADMRFFAFTFGDEPLEDVWPFYYDSEEKYNRLKRIKGEVDPKGIFSPDKFSLKPL